MRIFRLFLSLVCLPSDVFLDVCFIWWAVRHPSYKPPYNLEKIFSMRVYRIYKRLYRCEHFYKEEITDNYYQWLRTINYYG